MRDRAEIEQAIDAFGDAVWRVCALGFKLGADAQDAFQETFLKFATYEGSFADAEHKKAWLIRVASNVCKDMLKAARRLDVPLDESPAPGALSSHDATSQPGSAQSEVLDAMRALDDPPRTPVYLALYEGYTAPEIAEMLSAPVNTVYSWSSRGRKQLKEALS